VWFPKLAKKLFITLLVSGVGLLGITASGRIKPSLKADVIVDENLVLDETLFRSNQFTQPDDLTPVANYLTIPDSFLLVGETADLKLYMEEGSYAIRVQNKHDGFIYGSSFLAKEEDTPNFGATYENYVDSAVTIKYYSYGASTGVYTTIDEAILSSDDTTSTYVLIENGYHASIQMGDSGIGFDLIVYLDNDKLQVEVPLESITENDTYKLRSIRIFPFLGAVYGNSIPGYIFVPDGSGALIRYQDIDVHQDIYELSYYGSDLGIRLESANEPELLFPVTGMILGIKQHGFMTMIEAGAPFASFVINPAKRNLKYYYSHNEFLYRSLYQAPTSESQASQGTGRQVIQEGLNACQVRMAYRFLLGEEASYVGMAKIYQDHLIEEGHLVPSLKSSGNTPIYLEIIGAESKKGFLFDETVILTDLDYIRMILNELSEVNPNLTVTLKGVFKGGFSKSGLENTRFELKLGSPADFSALISAYQESDVDLYFYLDPMKAYEKSSVSAYQDVSQRINRVLLQTEELTQTAFLIAPTRIAEIFNDNVVRLAKQEIHNIALGTIGNTLYSDYKDSDHEIDRQQALEIYQGMLADFEGDSLLYRPNLGLLSSVSRYLMTPMTTSNYRIYSDTVPFMALVFHGVIEAFAPFANFNANQQFSLLQMIDYGLYPAYLLTQASAYQLQDTELGQIYSSSYATWKDQIIADAAFISGALGTLTDQVVVDREVLTTGIYVSTYANQTKVYVNYTNQDYSSIDGVVLARNYRVVIDND